EIVCIQEHWLWEFQKNWFEDNIENFQFLARCHDSNENLSNFNIPRGRSGVAILWKNDISNKVSKLDVGNERIVAVELNFDTKICLINVYMPTNKADSQYGYRECLDNLFDIIRRFETSHIIVLCGDLNGSLLQTRNNKHDIMLKDFVNEHCLSTGAHYTCQPTFYHFNGTVTSQIDYILTSNPEILKSYTVYDRQPENVSPHVPVGAELNICAPVKSMDTRIQNMNSSKSTPRIAYSWRKLDQDK
ncbi:MAG: endonuclease/exonuclease/phosphatase family protein, partial [Candidatus Thiodiazotropha taylori]|nr:endonuclease/exonuclease/phosphatase family protein [Candidatus Thiodiazotropha taylori]MCW4285683.1 endonuclease/exonuclease/phosphatase family protein [Candidatus Thiodiazotropha taylori]